MTARYRIDLDALEKAIDADRRAGLTPFLVVGTAGTVDTGAIDNLDALAAICRRERLWFHVDGAFGALAILAPDLAPRLKGIERADSLAFDFHKWGQVPYDAGFILVRDGVLHRKTFAASAPYLRKELRGLAAGAPWPCDYGPDLSRGFRALKTWFTLKVYGTEALGAVISRTCALARYLESRIAETPELELLAPVELNVVCFRYRAEDAQRINPRIVIELQESGLVAPSTTVLDGRLAIRVAIVNHRTSAEGDRLLGGKDSGAGTRHGSQRRAEPRATNQPDADWPPQRARESALRDLNGRIASNPADVSLRFELAACLLAEMGRTLEARNAYLDLLAREPSHRLALNNLGTLLHSTGYRTAARTAYAEAVARHPGDPMSHVNLGNVLYESGEFRAAREHFETALRVDPGHRGSASGPRLCAGRTRRRGGRAMAPAQRFSGSSRVGVAVSRGRAAGVPAVAGFVGWRQHPDPPFAGRPRLPDVRRGARVLRSPSAAAAASGGVQCHRRCRPGRAGIGSRAVRRGSHHGAGDQSAFGGAGDGPRRSCTACAACRAW